MTVTLFDDARLALQHAERFLAAEPCLHNLILTLLYGRREHHVPGRYWIASANGDVVGAALQSPLSFPINLSVMSGDVSEAIVEAIASERIDLCGVSGEAMTSARFAGQWTERVKGGAVPQRGQRLYAVDDVRLWPAVRGRLRVASPADRALLIDWLAAFHAEVGEDHADAPQVVDERIPQGRFWLWDADGTPKSMLCISPAIVDVVRIQIVYTPPAQRTQGFGGATVGTMSSKVRGAGERCILYTDLASAAPNSLYRRLGFRAIAECLSYRFTASRAA